MREIALARPGKFVVCEYENGTLSQDIKFLLDGVLKQSIQFKIMVSSVVQEVPMFGLGVLTDVGYKEPLADCWILCAVSNCVENGKPRAYNVKMLVMTFRSACVRSRWPR